jgi:hypothetical protein
MIADNAIKEVVAYEDIEHVYIQKEDELTRLGHRPAPQVFKEVPDEQISASSRLGLRGF